MWARHVQKLMNLVKRWFFQVLYETDVVQMSLASSEMEHTNAQRTMVVQTYVGQRKLQIWAKFESNILFYVENFTTTILSVFLFLV